jgi:endonuclease/exonuclease/phosphatase family metal-dependent hydrolase
VLVVGILAFEHFTGIQLLDRTGSSSTSSPAQSSPTQRVPPAPSEAVATNGLRIVSWNIRDMGGSKDDEEVAFMAQTLRDADVVAIQEVITSPKGAQAIARLDAELDRTGFAWDYRLSDPTTGKGTERYAFLWKPSRARLVGQAWLEESLADVIDREPFCARFESRRTGQRVLIASLHAVPTSKDPETEVAYLDDLHRRYASDHMVILGDFNLDEDDEAFDELRALGYGQALDDQPTSLRRKRRDGPLGHFANEYDNIFYEQSALQAARTGIMDFTRGFDTLKEARYISDHVPLYIDVQWTASPASTP